MTCSVYSWCIWSKLIFLVYWSYISHFAELSFRYSEDFIANHCLGVMFLVTLIYFISFPCPIVAQIFNTRFSRSGIKWELSVMFAVGFWYIFWSWGSFHLVWFPCFLKNWWWIVLNPFVLLLINHAFVS